MATKIAHVPIATIRKNNSEDVRVSRFDRSGVGFVDVRVFSAAKSGDRYPSVNGFTLVATAVPALVEALQLAVETPPEAVSVTEIPPQPRDGGNPHPFEGGKLLPPSRQAAE